MLEPKKKNPYNRILEDRPLTNAEKQRRFQDKACSIDVEMDEALSKIDWNRRNEAEKDLGKWVETYCIGLLLDETPPEDGYKALGDMQKSVTSHSNFLIALARGSGKSSYTLCTALYAISTGIQKFVVIVSNNARASSGLLADLWRAIAQKDTAFAQDYPEVCLPFQVSNGSYRRKQLYKGDTTEICKNSANIILATIHHEDGTPFKTSNSIVTVRGISSGIRGLKHGTLRPTMVILDDLQTTESAQNPEQVNKIIETINKDIIPLAGKERLSILQTATPICPEDVVEKLMNDSNWKTTIYPAIMSYPKNMQLWKEYFKLFDTENVKGVSHKKSLEFYRTNQQEMDDGAKVFNPKRFSSKDGHISAIQKLLEIRHAIGNNAFQSEYQMKPVKFSYSIDITPKKVIEKTSGFRQFEVPDGYTFVAASSDLNLSYCISTTIIAYKLDMTAALIGHVFTPCSISTKLTDSEYNMKVYETLATLGKELKALNIPGMKWCIDCNGVPFDAVTQFCNSSVRVCGLQAIGMIGRSSHIWTGNLKSRLRNEVDRTVLCGDSMERVKAGTGKKWIAFDTDYYREKVQKAMLAPIGSSGSLCIYDAPPDEHTEFATQFCNERLLFVKHRQDGRNQYTWKSKEPHDMLDSVSQNFALCASQGITSSNFDTESKPRTTVRHKRRRFMLV